MYWKAEGLWHGHYAFDSMPDCPVLPPSVEFGMRLTQSRFFGLLRGEVWEEPPDGMPGRGVIKGRVTRTGISFVKRMPICYVWYDGQSVPFAEYISRTFGMNLDAPIPHPLIKYVGEYRPDEDELTGTWTFTRRPRVSICDGQPLIFEAAEGSGRWVARRSRDPDEAGP